MADSIATCCNGTGFVKDSICIQHLQEAYFSALAKSDKELAAVILLKASGRLETTHG